MYKSLDFNPLADLVPVALIGESQAALVVHPLLPVKNVAELVAYVKARPDQRNFASTGARGDRHEAPAAAARGAYAGGGAGARV